MRRLPRCSRISGTRLSEASILTSPIKDLSIQVLMFVSCAPLSSSLSPCSPEYCRPAVAGAPPPRLPRSRRRQRMQPERRRRNGETWKMSSNHHESVQYRPIVTGTLLLLLAGAGAKKKRAGRRLWWGRSAQGWGSSHGVCPVGHAGVHRMDLGAEGAQLHVGGVLDEAGVALLPGGGGGRGRSRSKKGARVSGCSESGESRRTWLARSKT